MTASSISPLTFALAALIGIVALRLAVGAALRLLLPRRWRALDWLTRSARNRHAAGLWQAMARRLPRTTQFIRDRFSPDRFTGLPLTVVCLIVAVMLALFSELSEEMLEDEEVTAVDQALLQALDPLRDPVLIDVFAWITHLGGNPALLAATVTGLAFLWARGRYGLLIGAAVTIVGSQTALWIGKYAFHRVRPEFLFEVTASSPSYPSGHTTGAVAIYGFLAFAASRLSADPRTRLELLFWGAILALTIAFSRPFLHVHYPSDVAAGLLLGGIWLLLGIAVSLWLESHRANVSAHHPDREGEARGISTPSG